MRLNIPFYENNDEGNQCMQVTMKSILKYFLDKDYTIFYHESGPKNPEPNKAVLKKTFIEAWNANGTDNDMVIVYGKRNKK